jgi:hypothetical protein
MSLVITSNIGTENTPDTSNAFKPYSYQNRLLNTMRIPANSEIALQSAKINKNGLFVLDRTNSGFNTFFGTPVDQVHSKNINDTTTQPFKALIGAGDAFRAGDVKNEVNIDDMVGEIQRGINEATFHPSLITGASSTGVVVSAKYDSSNFNFEGFKFVATQQTAKTNRTTANITWTDVSKNEEYNFSDTNGTVESTDLNGFLVQNRQFPLSQNNGECIFNFSDANSGGRWMVGLSRINQLRLRDETYYDFLPDYFDDTIAGAPLGGVQTRGQIVYADVCVMRVGSELRVYQSGARTAAGRGQGIFMNEVTYYGQA